MGSCCTTCHAGCSRKRWVGVPWLVVVAAACLGLFIYSCTLLSPVGFPASTCDRSNVLAVSPFTIMSGGTLYSCPWPPSLSSWRITVDAFAGLVCVLGVFAFLGLGRKRRLLAVCALLLLVLDGMAWFVLVRDGTAAIASAAECRAGMPSLGGGGGGAGVTCIATSIVAVVLVDFAIACILLHASIILWLRHRWDRSPPPPPPIQLAGGGVPGGEGPAFGAPEDAERLAEERQEQAAALARMRAAGRGGDEDAGGGPRFV